MIILNENTLFQHRGVRQELGIIISKLQQRVEELTKLLAGTDRLTKLQEHLMSVLVMNEDITNVRSVERIIWFKLNETTCTLNLDTMDIGVVDMDANKTAILHEVNEAIYSNLTLDESVLGFLKGAGKQLAKKAASGAKKLASPVKDVIDSGKQAVRDDKKAKEMKSKEAQEFKIELLVDDINILATNFNKVLRRYGQEHGVKFKEQDVERLIASKVDSMDALNIIVRALKGKISLT